eukprot:g4899.t1
MRTAVALPRDEELFEWLAVHTVDFFNEISLLFGTVKDFCTHESCPVMRAGKKYEYHWADGVTIKKPIKVSAVEYINYLMTWVEGQLSDESVFPVQEDRPFPRNFESIVRKIFSRLFRVYAHIYHSHIEEVRRIGAAPHLNTCFKHFTFFVHEFRLVSAKELGPLMEPPFDLVTAFLSKDGPYAESAHSNKEQHRREVAAAGVSSAHAS